MNSDKAADQLTWRNLGLFAMTCFALLTAIQNVKFLSGNAALFEPSFQEKYLTHWPVVFVHGLTAIVALAIGPVQFVPAIRKRFRRLHRNVGKVYILCVLFAAPTGFIMGTMAHGGGVPQVTFMVLSVLWFGTTLMGWITARQRKFQIHQSWMILSYALTFGAVVLRLELILLQLAGFDFHEVYPWTALTSWVPGLFFAVWFVKWKNTDTR